ncbi:MAG: NAD(P)/FAD-dependent oxidoreductase [Actinomycetota bacterium]|nr:NAD(P)/FAD-dependent oxidoreductase [Actinomycetota bacterium]
MAARGRSAPSAGTADVVLVGSGINALVCAALLSRAGMGVVVLERGDVLGGAIRTSQLTAPGFHHDVFSAWHPLFVTSEAYTILSRDLERHGLSYACAHEVTATATVSADARVMTRSREENIVELERCGRGEGERYRAEQMEFEAHAGFVAALLSGEVLSPATAKAALREVWRRRPHGALSLVGTLTESARTWLSRAYRTSGPPALFSPWVLHTGLGPDAAGSGIMDRAIVGLLEQVGLPVPQGGAARLVEALQAVIEEHGGTCRTGAEVDRVLVRAGRAHGVRLVGGEVVGATRAVVCGVAPPALYDRLLADAPVPAWARTAAGRFRFGRAGMQVHYALSSVPRWRQDDRLARVPVVHLTTGLDGVSRAVAEAERGLLPARATIVCGQPCAVDASRAPQGSWILWVQLQELPAHPSGDAAGEIDVGDGTWTEELRERYADRIQHRLGEHIEGFESSVVARVALSPSDIARENPNLVGGDIYAGACDLDQSLVLRPRPELSGHATPVPGVYHIGASTHPGPGLGAASGTIVAKRLLRRRSLSRRAR